MLVIARGESGKHHISRGDLAREFINGLAIAKRGLARVILKGRSAMWGMHYTTTTGMPAVTLLEENIRDEEAIAVLEAITSGRAKKETLDAPVS